MKIRREIGRAVIGNLPLVTAVGAHHHQFEFYRHDQMFGKKLFITRNFLRRFWPAGTPDNPLAVLRVPCAAVVAEIVRKAALLGPVDVHVVNFQIAVTCRGEHDLLAVGRDGALGVIAVRRGKPLQIRSIGPG